MAERRDMDDPIFPIRVGHVAPAISLITTVWILRLAIGVGPCENEVVCLPEWLPAVALFLVIATPLSALLGIFFLWRTSRKSLGIDISIGTGVGLVGGILSAFDYSRL